MSSNLINMDHIAMPLRTPAARGIATADTIGLPPADWSAFDQELIDSVLFPSAPAHATTAVSTPPPSSSSHAMFPLHHDFTGLSQATVSPSGAIIGARPVESETMSPLPLDQSGLMGTKRPAPQDVTGAQPKQPKKRQRKYTDDTRAKHREVQRRFINRKKERLDQEKMLAVVLEKQVQLLQAQSEAASLESERSSLLQQCVANGIDLDGQDMTVFLEEEMEALSQYYTPLQPSEASAILQQTLRYVDGFCPDEAFLDEGINFVGWNHQSRVEQKTISFRISKEFPETAPAQVFESTGFAMATVEHFSNFFGSGVVIKTKLLQIIDMNTVILYRAIYHPATKEISRFVELLCRVKRGDDYLILMQSLEGLNIQTFVGTQESWVRGVVWCAIKPQIGNDNGCSIQWTGCVGQCPTESLEQWRRDLMFLILRYEGLVIKPLVQLTIEDEPTDSNTKPTESQPQSLQPTTASSRSSESSASSSSGDDDSDGSNDADDTATGSDSA